jgi:ADP-ribosylglycohydrolase
MQALDRARGALYGLAIGDALGMPAEGFTRQQVIERWGPLLTGFEAAPPDNSFAAGRPAGSVTDDTEQAVLLGRLLVRGHGEIDLRAWAAALVAWEADMAARGLRRLLGPSTKRAVAAVLAGAPPEEAGLGGDTNGAAMRIAPVGIAFPGGSHLLDHVRQACLVTHNTPVAMAGAAAVAAAVSAAIDGAAAIGGAALPAAFGQAIAAARAAGHRSAARPAGESAPDTAPATGAPRTSPATTTPGHADIVAGQAGVAGAQADIAGAQADIAARIEWAVTGVPARSPQEAIGFIADEVGTSLATWHSVPAAFAVLAAVPDDPWRACLLAASLGGDSDTIAAMAGAITGACHGLSAFPERAIATVDAHGLDLLALADALYELRSA